MFKKKGGSGETNSIDERRNWEKEKPRKKAAKLHLPLVGGKKRIFADR